MSIRIMSAVFEIDGMGPTHRLILLALADHADDAGRCYPSVARLCGRTGLKERSVQTNLKALCDAGYLRIEMNAGPKGCNVYHITATPAADAPPQEMHPAGNAGTPAADALTPAADAPEPSRTIKEPSKNTPIVPNSGFDEFYALCPRKKAPDRAEKAYRAALKKTTHETLCNAMRLYAKEREGKEATYTLHPASWLNGGNWKNQPEETPLAFGLMWSTALAGVYLPRFLQGWQRCSSLSNMRRRSFCHFHPYPRSVVDCSCCQGVLPMKRLFVIPLVLAGCDVDYTPAPRAEVSQAEIQLGIEAVSRGFFDPDSTQVRKVVTYRASTGERLVCGEVNAKNRLGGFAGYRPFFARIGRGEPYGVEGVTAQIQCDALARGDGLYL